MSNLNKGLRQASGSTAEDGQLISIATQLNVPVSSVMFLRKGYAINSARFAFDEDLNRLWRIPYDTPKNTIIDKVIDNNLNENIPLIPMSLIPSPYYFIWAVTLGEGVWIRTNKDLVWSIKDGVWYRYIKDITAPFIAKTVSPKEDGTVFGKGNPDGVWEDMGETGIGSSYKGDKGDIGERGKDLIKAESTATPSLDGLSTEVSIITQIEDSSEQVLKFDVTNGKPGLPGKDGNNLIVAEASSNALPDGKATRVTITTQIENQTPQTHTFDVKEGQDGNTWITGNIVPPETLGKVGDLYLHDTTYEYYKKETTGWVNKGKLGGASGGISDADSDGHVKVRMNAEWKNIEDVLYRYSLKTVLPTNTICDLTEGNIFKLKDVSGKVEFKNLPENRSMTIILVVYASSSVTGYVNAIDWVTTPEYGTVRTIVPLFWDGETLTGGVTIKI